MQKRWLVYILIGLIFGWADWYFLDFLASFSRNQALNDAIYQLPALFQMGIVAIFIILNYGVWLIPVIPTAVYEMKFSYSVWRAALAAVTVWSAALLSYYAYYTFLLMFIGLPNLDFMLISNRLFPHKTRRRKLELSIRRFNLHSSISSGGPSGKPNQRQNSWCPSISWLQFMQTPLNFTFPQSKVQASLNTSLRFSQCGQINLQIVI